MNIIFKFSGLLAMFFAWVFVVLPGTIGVDGRKQTITYATRNRKYMRIINFGLIIGAVFQTLFLFYILGKFSISFLSLGSLLYLSTTTATFLVAVFIERSHKKLHDFFTQYYFVVHPLSVLLIGLSLKENYNILFLVSLTISLSYLVGEGYLIYKYRNRNAIMEQLAFFLLSIWTVFMTFA